MYMDIAVIASLVGVALCITFFVGLGVFIYSDAKKESADASDK
ncbi:MAG TPA: cytochrome c oxidase subunit CcoM [Alcanivoracaceae bacterium]|nr:cytochrome c oxidase subunit CcoM [Alcanivoracaceae bacterium]